MKLDTETKRFYRTLALVLCLVIIYIFPRSFDRIMQFNGNKIIECEAYYDHTEVIDGEIERYYKYIEFDTGSEDYNELMELLRSVKYRRHLANFFTGGNDGTYSITLEPYAIIFFSDGITRYEYRLYGKDLPAGRRHDMFDYTPKGGLEFQRKVVEFIDTHGEIKEEFIETN